MLKQTTWFALSFHYKITIIQLLLSKVLLLNVTIENTYMNIKKLNGINKKISFH
jgi:hypothetical protein